MRPSNRRPMRSANQKPDPDQPKPQPKRGNHYRCELLDEENGILYVGHGSTARAAKQDALRVAHKRSDQWREVGAFTITETIQRGPIPRLSDEEKKQRANERVKKAKGKGSKKKAGGGL